ncbi:DUF411 domain-containing protein [Fortiea sp. LEGE XX443]|uniref:DUF411 domain-containing protein n=1 Tax=Fortiea sp. LEGE XX443 TaxID=1828611 RepID=UPI00188002D8|nr:DUF411 domain-containing protein [Fortiea sp. LEGE XX443]MBE9005738.1 DUF411 domain-containing protein [Fortiea sp. LEGE XX443]
MYKLFSSVISTLLRASLAIIIITVVAITADVSILATSSTSAIASNRPEVIAGNIGENKTEPDSAKPEITIYRSPTCSCCGAWLEHVQQHGFKIREDIKTDEMEAIKQKYNLPPELASCHTAIIDGYVMEGHIPADDIKLFLKQKPQLAGLAVPGMPVGTPGMESGNIKQPFTVMTFNQKGEITIFKQWKYD